MVGWHLKLCRLKTPQWLLNVPSFVKKNAATVTVMVVCVDREVDREGHMDMERVLLTEHTDRTLTTHQPSVTVVTSFL